MKSQYVVPAEHVSRMRTHTCSIKDHVKILPGGRVSDPDLQISIEKLTTSHSRLQIPLHHEMVEMVILIELLENHVRLEMSNQDFQCVSSQPIRD